MEKLKRLKKRFETTCKAILNLEKAVNKFTDLNPENSEMIEFMREVVIKRFEYSWELFWKLLKDYLEDVEGLVVPSSPRKIIALALEADIIDESQFQILNNMVDDRNLTSHAYHEDIAEKVARDVVNYLITLNNIVLKIKNQI